MIPETAAPAPATAAVPTCRACGRPQGMPCRSTRDMEDANDPGCTAALMMRGGGEYTANRMSCGKWHATLLFAAFRAGLAAQGDGEAGDVLAEMATHRLVARDAETGTWRDLTPESDRPAIVEGLVAAGLAEASDRGPLATARGFDTVMGRTDPWLR